MKLKSTISQVLVVAAIGAVVGGCAGLDIYSLSTTSAATAHTKDRAVSGYIVYHPMVVLEISEKEVCVGPKDANGKCTQSEFRCGAGAPFLLPDYSKPYVVDIKAGLGKAGAEIELVDGWRLGKAKDASDNTALLGLIQKFMATAGIIAPGGAQTGRQTCQAAGLYRVNLQGDSAQLIPLRLY